MLKIPESYCKECNLFYQAVKQASEEVETDVDIRVKSFWTGFPFTVLKGGYHAPVLFIDGELVAQGYDVPDKETVKKKLSEAKSKD